MAAALDVEPRVNGISAFLMSTVSCCQFGPLSFPNPPSMSCLIVKVPLTVAVSGFGFFFFFFAVCAAGPGAAAKAPPGRRP